jgi:hypothetical protein
LIFNNFVKIGQACFAYTLAGSHREKNKEEKQQFFDRKIHVTAGLYRGGYKGSSFC